MGSVKTISIIVAANIKGLENGLGKANKSLAKFASGAARMGSLLSFGVTAPLMALGKTAFDTFAEFEDSMMKVNVVTGATTSEFNSLTKEAKRLGRTTRFTASEFSKLQLILGRKGFDPTEIIAMEEAIAKLALATGEDLSLAADTVSSSLNAFNLEADESNRIANTLAMAAANSSIQLSTFSTAFGHAGSAAHAVGVDIEELSAMMGVLMDNGIKASKAGTGLRKAFSRLHEEGIPFGKTLDNISNGTMTWNEALALVGETGANQLFILANQKDKVDELTTSYKENTTALDKMTSKMESTAKDKVLKMNSAIESMNIELGALLSERLVPIIRKITELASNFSNLDKDTQNLIITIAALAASVGAFLLVLAAVVAVAGLVAAPLAAIGGALAAIAAGAAAVVAWLGVSGVVGVLSVLGISLFAAKNSTDDLTEAQKELNKENGNFMLSSWDKVKALESEAAAHYDIAEGIRAAIKEAKLLKDLEFLKKRASENPIISLSKKTVSSVGEGSEPSVLTGREDFDGDEIRTTFSSLEKLFPLLELSETQLQGLNDTVRGVFSSFSQGFVDLFDKQTKFIEVNGKMEEVTIGFGEKFGTFLKEFLIGIGKMIVQTAILAGLLALTGLGGVGASGAALGFGDLFKNIIGGAFADGGSPPVGKVSLVGERGAELFVPNQAGTIIPNHLLGGGTEGTTNIVIPNVTISGDDLLIVFDRANRRKERR